MKMRAIVLLLLLLCGTLSTASIAQTAPKVRKIEGDVIKVLSTRSVLINDDTFGLIVARGVKADVGERVSYQGTVFTTTQMPWKGTAVWVEIVDVK